MNSECILISNAPQWAVWPKPKVVGRANCVASPISGQLAWPKMGDFELARVCRRPSEIDILARVTSLYGGAEVGDLKGYRAALSIGKCAVPQAQLVAISLYRWHRYDFRA